jgi:hypothetical protein
MGLCLGVVMRHLPTIIASILALTGFGVSLFSSTTLTAMQLNQGEGILLSMIFLVIAAVMEYMTRVTANVAAIKKHMDTINQYGSKVVINMIPGLKNIHSAAEYMINNSLNEDGGYIKAVTCQYGGESDSAGKEKFLKAKDKRIKGGWNCQDIIVLTERTRAICENRIANYGHLKNYALAVLDYDHPFTMRMLIVSGIRAHLRIPSEHNVFEPGSCLEFEGKVGVKHLEVWFDQLWSAASKIKSIEDLTIHQDRLDEIAPKPMGEPDSE